jgi:hypothetical protein
MKGTAHPAEHIDAHNTADKAAHWIEAEFLRQAAVCGKLDETSGHMDDTSEHSLSREARTDFNAIFPQRLQALIEQSGESLRAISMAMGISKTQLIRLKDGRSQPLGATILALARYFEVEPGYFYGPLPTPEEIDLLSG